MLSTSDVIAFASTADLVRSRAFYEEVLGLSLVDQNDYACVFDAHGTMLRVTVVDVVARPGYTVLGWRVDDISETICQLTAQGVEFVRYDGMPQDAHGVWTTSNGDRIAWFHDPDENVLSLTEFAGWP